MLPALPSGARPWTRNGEVMDSGQPGTLVVAPAASPTPRRRAWRAHGAWVAGLILFTLAGAFSYTRLDQGWKPYDEGSLAHAAERVSAGELPHRDFDDVYTGGLSILNAAGFRLIGDSLLTPRRLLFVLYLLTIPAVYYLARRFLEPVAALVAAALALLHNVPIYPAAMPSWYNLLFALLGAAAVFHYAECQRRRWLAAAGLLAGISITMKITGLFFVAGVLLWLMYVAQEDAARHRHQHGALPFTLHLAGLGLFTLLVLALIWPRISAAELVYFGVPVLSVVTLLVAREIRLRMAGLGTATPYSRIALFVGTCAMPLLVFAVPYAASGSLQSLFNGVVFAPTGRLSQAAIRPPAPVTALSAVPLAILLFLALRHGRVPRALLVPLALLLVAGILGAQRNDVFLLVVASMRWTPVLAVIAGVSMLWRSFPGTNADRELFLLIALTAVISLMQYPFAHPLYLWYVAAFAILATAGAIGIRATSPPLAFGLVALFYMGFSLQHTEWHPEASTLAIERAPLRVPADEKERYERVVSLLREHGSGDYIWAGPDSPELYFLTGRQNPTRHVFEFLAQRGNAEAEILEGIERQRVTAVAWNRARYFTDLSDAFETELLRRFPSGETVENFEVRWR